MQGGAEGWGWLSLGKDGSRGAGSSQPVVSSSGLPISRKMRSYWRESSGGLRRGWRD